MFSSRNGLSSGGAMRSMRYHAVSVSAKGISTRFLHTLREWNHSATLVRRWKWGRSPNGGPGLRAGASGIGGGAVPPLELPNPATGVPQEAGSARSQPRLPRRAPVTALPFRWSPGTGTGTHSLRTPTPSHSANGHRGRRRAPVTRRQRRPLLRFARSSGVWAGRARGWGPVTCPPRPRLPLPTLSPAA